MVKKTSDEALEIIDIERGYATMHILGRTPLLCNRFSKKAREQLLLPSAKMNSAEKQLNLKHDPVAEFRESVCLNRDKARAAALHVPEGAFRKAIAAAALDMPGATKSKVARLTSLTVAQIDLYGLPRLKMAMVRQSDMNRTPDVRTRAQFDRWACSVTVGFVTLLKERQVVSLMAAAGMIVGIGDYRPQKGGDYGQFEIVGKDDPEWSEIVAKEGRVAQLAALANPVCADLDSEELLSWYEGEVDRREKHVPSSGKEPKRKASVRAAATNGASEEAGALAPAE